MKKAQQVALGLLLIVGGCVCNNFFLELIISPKRNTHADPSAGPLLTFMQFVAVAALSGLARLQVPPGSWLPRMKPRNVPLLEYAKLTGIFFCMSALNNYAFALHISQPLHMVFRSASVVATWIVGSTFFNKKYSVLQLVAVLCVSIGALLATAAEALVGDTADAAAAECCDEQQMTMPKGDAGLDSTPETGSFMFTWYLGIAVLTAVLTLSAFLSQYQDVLYKSYGRDSLEMLFFSHFLALPCFMLAAGDLATHAQLWSNSPPVTAALAHLFGPAGTAASAFLGPFSSMPSTWFYVLGNVISQYVCVRGVFLVGQAAGALTLTLSLTVRKFISLFLSIWFFNNKFTTYHWGGAALVFTGIVIYNLGKAMAPAPPADVKSTAKQHDD